MFASGIAGSTQDTLAGLNVEHLLLGLALGFVAMFLLWEDNFREVDGYGALAKYVSLFSLAILLGFLSSIEPGFKVTGAGQLVYWLGLVASIFVAALAALRGYTKWVLVAIALTGFPVAASVLESFFPPLARFVPTGRVHELAGGRVLGLFENPNTTGFLLYCSMAGCLCLYHLATHTLTKWASVLLCSLYLIAVLPTLSRASILVSFLIFLAFLYTLWRRTSHRLLLLGIALVISIFAAGRVQSRYNSVDLKQTRVLDVGSYERDTFRFRSLMGAVRNLHRTAFLGVGTGRYREMSHIYLMGFNNDEIRHYDKSPHNQIVAIWVEWGFLAFLLMYSAHAWVFVRGIRSGLWRSESGFMLLAAYASILLYLQLHGTNTPASCALLGLCAGHVFAYHDRALPQASEYA